MPTIDEFDPTKLRAVLADLGLSTPAARGVEGLLILWHLAMQMHPAMSTDNPPPPLQGSELAVWERFYKEEAFLFQFISEIVPMDRIKEIGQYIAERGDPGAGADFIEFRPDGPIHRSLAGRFMRHVLLPYLFWNQDGPWRDYGKASFGDEEAMKRLLTIDENILNLPSLMNIWRTRFKAEPKVYQRLWNAKQRRLQRVLENDDEGETVLDEKTWRSKKSRFVAELAVLLEDRGHPLNEPQLRKICNAFMAGLGFDTDPTLPGSNEALARAIHRHKRGSQRNSSSS